MQQRNPSRGGVRPSGTDGFDYSYRMTVDQRYRKVAQRRSQLYRALLCQAACQVLGILWVTLVILKGREVNRIAMLSSAIGIIALSAGETGRRWSDPKLLNLYMLASSIATTLSLIYCDLGHFSDQFFSYSNQDQDTDTLLVLFDVLEGCRVLAGVLVQIIAVPVTISLLKNMSTKRTSWKSSLTSFDDFFWRWFLSLGCWYKLLQFLQSCLYRKTCPQRGLLESIISDDFFWLVLLWTVHFHLKGDKNYCKSLQCFLYWNILKEGFLKFYCCYTEIVFVLWKIEAGDVSW